MERAIHKSCCKTEHQQSSHNPNTSSPKTGTASGTCLPYKNMMPLFRINK
jgi:hypothetical protein